jgi:MYXO-CTERM domain-containing protein
MRFGCGGPAIAPGAQPPVSALGWRFQPKITKDRGLAIMNVSLGDRMMAKELSLPFYWFSSNKGVDQVRCQLTPVESPGSCTSRLVRYRSRLDIAADKVVVEATYVRSPDDSECLEITQQYEFYRERDPKKEPAARCDVYSDTPCAMFRPMVKYQFYPTLDATVDGQISIETSQLLVFDVDHPLCAQKSPSVALYHVCGAGDVCSSPVTSGSYGNPMPSSALVDAINGGRQGDVDSLHVTSRAQVVEPGCPECVNIHWRWPASAAAQWNLPQFNDGAAIVPQGSSQWVSVGVFNYRDSVGSHDIPNRIPKQVPPDRSLAKADAIPEVWYVASSDAASDVFFSHGGFFSSMGTTAPKTGQSLGPDSLGPAAAPLDDSAPVGPGTCAADTGCNGCRVGSSPRAEGPLAPLAIYLLILIRRRRPATRGHSS